MSATSTPTRSALLQFVESLAISALLAGFFSAYPFLSGEATDWRTVGTVFLSSALYSVATSLATYYKLKPPPGQTSMTAATTTPGTGDPPTA